MVKDIRPDNIPGHWNDYWRKATQDDVVTFQAEIINLKEKIVTIKALKESHPDIFF